MFRAICNSLCRNITNKDNYLMGIYIAQINVFRRATAFANAEAELPAFFLVMLAAGVSINQLASLHESLNHLRKFCIVSTIEYHTFHFLTLIYNFF